MELVEVGKILFAEPSEDVGASNNFVIYSGCRLRCETSPFSYGFQQFTLHLAGELECVRGWVPPEYLDRVQGVRFEVKGDNLVYAEDPPGSTPSGRRTALMMMTRSMLSI